MKKIENAICNNHIKILVITLILGILSILGMIKTKINYDILIYLPEDIETIKGQNILTEDFNIGAFSVAVIEDMSASKITNLEKDLIKIDGVEKVVSGYDIIGNTIPIEILPEEIITKIKKENTDIMLITFTNSTSSEETLNAIEEVRNLTKEQCKIGGMSSLVLDTMNLSETEIVTYIIIAVLLCLIVLELSLDSYIVPFILLLNIGISILFNLGTNIIFGSISYITKALVAVLQLGVTTDFSIFLYHAYEKEKSKNLDKKEAMKKAIHKTFTSVIGSSLTTIAGFLVLCTMELTLGKDLGLVMAKGVLIGVICVLTVFPSLLLISDKLIEKTKHKSIIPKLNIINNFVVKQHKIIFIIFLILLIPAYLANSKIDVYYKLDESLPDTLESIIANKELKEKFNIVSPEIILIDKNTTKSNLTKMINEIENINGIDFVLSFNNLEQIGINRELLDEETLKIFESEKYELVLINSTYEIASNELNKQVEEINKIIKKYDKNSILAGEGPLMKDLVSISDNDFKHVNISSIICILLIMVFVLKSTSLPILLILIIEFAIFINMSIPYYTGITLPFVAPIVLGTIQLGATIDYAILLTTAYINNRKKGINKEESIKNTLDNGVNSILVSGLCFFAATFGVGVYSDLEMISSLCTLISRGAIISMIVVILVLPSVLLIFDKLITKTTQDLKKKGKIMNKKIQKVTGIILILFISIYSFPIYALKKEETVYINLNNDGSIKKTLVNTHLINKEKENELIDETELKDILNINGEETFTKSENKIIWNSNGNDIYYEGSTDKELPIEISIKYLFNDEEKPLEEIIGKKGNIKIKIKYTNKDKHLVKINGKNETLYTPFVVTTGLILKNENNSNLNIKNGKIKETGNDNIVIGLSTPGLYESLNLEELKGLDEVTISFDTVKFEMPNMYSVVVPKIIEKDDLKIFDRLDDLFKNVNVLKSSIDEIQKGSESLVNGTEVLNEGSKLIYENLETVVNNLEKLSVGSTNINEGLKEILVNLNNTKSLLGSVNLNDLNTLLTENKKTIDLLNQIDPVTNENLIDLLTQNNNALNNVLTLSSNIEKVINTLEEYLKILEKGSKEINEGTISLVNGVKVLNEKTQELHQGINRIYEGSKELNNGIIKFNNEGITKLNNYLNINIRSTQNKITELVNLGEEYKTFGTSSKEINGETKFILKTSGMKYKEEKIVKKEEKEKPTLWMRIKNLFN